VKVLQAIHGLDKNSGGASTYMKLLAQGMAAFPDVSVEVIAIDSGNNIEIDSPVKCTYVKARSAASFAYSSEYTNLVNRIDADIYHGNGLWQYPVHAMVKSAIRKKKPFIISPHGMLEPWSLTQGRLKKKLLMIAFQKKDIHRSRAIHVTSELEANHVKSLRFENPIAVIPNGINTNEFVIPQKRIRDGKKTLLFLSRIHKKKGIELLLDSWGVLNPAIRSDWQIAIAGDGDREYVKALQEEVDRRNLTDSIKFLGPVWGKEKVRLYQQADLFVLPTYSENFGIVVAEALACGVPVITTKGAPWQELQSRQCGWWTAINLTSIQSALEEALSLSEGELIEMGQRGRKLIEEKYDYKIVSRQMIDLYYWLLDRSSKPSFII
jgi:glycosyltransferase involved in cell wall biosynthesis